jgi:hypothetical protein
MSEKSTDEVSNHIIVLSDEVSYQITQTCKYFRQPRRLESGFDGSPWATKMNTVLLNRAWV